jgi:selenocysteine-specific elongation factor
MFVIGTAGHIDHGKSSIIKRLTGMDPDRLPEEKDRGLTIDLGFAWMTLPNGERVGFVDVPGHERFVKNMIAGVGSIDAALLVIAADDGWMPQTEEHLQILELLGIKKGLILLNKIDLAEPDWLELVKGDIESRLKDRSVDFLDIVPVSAADGTGFDTLPGSLEKLLEHTRERADIGKPRLYADRAFTIAGMGSVITGTLTGGKLKVGDDVAVYPYGVKGRIRNLQTHKQSIETAVQGSRVAVNITGGDRDIIHRGIMISSLLNLATSDMLNCHVQIPASGRTVLKHNSDVVFLLGTTELLGRVLLLEHEYLRPGQSGLCKIKLPGKVCPFIGDRFIIRQPSPAATIGGGVILDFRVTFRIRKGSRELEYLKALYPMNPENVITSILNYKGLWGPNDYSYVINSIFRSDAYRDNLEKMKEDGTVLSCAGFYFSTDYYRSCFARIRDNLEKFHKQYPWLPGLGARELIHQTGLPSDDAGSCLLDLYVENGELVSEKGSFRLKEHVSALSPKLKEIASVLLQDFLERPSEAPTRPEIEKKGKDHQVVVKYLLSTGSLVDCRGVLLHPRIYEKWKAAISDYLNSHGKAKSTDLRKVLNTTRKYAIPFLEKLDQDGVTAFDGEFRSLNRKE